MILEIRKHIRLQRWVQTAINIMPPNEISVETLANWLELEEKADAASNLPIISYRFCKGSINCPLEIDT